MNQKGFSNSVLVLVVLVLVAAGVGGFVLLGGDDEEDADATNQTSQDVTPSTSDETNAEEAESDAVVEDDNEDENDDDGAVKSFTIDAFSFGFSEETINVNPGDEVTINLTNSGGSHNWVVDEIDGASTSVIGAGETDSVTFTVPEDAAGQTFNFYCSVGNHRAQGMEGNIVVSS